MREIEPLPNPFYGIPSAGIGAQDPIAFMIDYGWDDPDVVERKAKDNPNETQMLQEMWDVAKAQGRMQGQMEAGIEAQAKLDTKHKRVEDLETALARCEDDVTTKLQEKIERLRVRLENALSTIGDLNRQRDEMRRDIERFENRKRWSYRFWERVVCIGLSRLRTVEVDSRSKP